MRPNITHSNKNTLQSKIFLFTSKTLSQDYQYHFYQTITSSM